MYRKEIVYDREVRDFACYIDGELVGFAHSYLEAEIVLDQLVFELMSGQFFDKGAPIDPPSPPDEPPTPPPWEDCCRACDEPHHVQNCPQIWSYLRAGPEADVCISCGDDLQCAGPSICGACIEAGELYAIEVTA